MSCNTPSDKICQQCGAAFSCMALVENEICWCMHLPAVLAVPDQNQFSDCLCPRCLAQRVQHQLSKTNQSI
ncbi:cysteine-rich CWC family protein [Chitinibacter sp. SCUT-21]|uniref:cysteine-rich CWC family protein n=1 Tax=Chitinibacter sp. SCUT-21 TaxID=2970891 RepID=UPI0035A5E561